jgi:hypothetical protein
MKMSNKVLLSRPKDNSFEAFKAWMNEIYKHLTGKSDDDGSLTDEELKTAWKEFWSKE